MAATDQVGVIAASWVSGLKSVLGGKLYGAYIFGASAFPDTLPLGDIDFHVILTDALTEDERARLELLHESLARDFPPLGGEMDGYYILLRDARGSVPPESEMWTRATDFAWALHREHLRAGRCMVLYGPNPREFYRPATWPEIEEALRSELAFVEANLEKHPAYCILNLCRLIYSFESGDVVISKAAAAVWAYDALPEWRRHVELAKKSYAGDATPEERRFMSAECGALYRFAYDRIEIARRKRVRDCVDPEE